MIDLPYGMKTRLAGKYNKTLVWARKVIEGEYNRDHPIRKEAMEIMAKYQSYKKKLDEARSIYLEAKEDFEQKVDAIYRDYNL